MCMAWPNCKYGGTRTHGAEVYCMQCAILVVTLVHACVSDSGFKLHHVHDYMYMLYNHPTNMLTIASLL